jgi:hypothetical protein
MRVSADLEKDACHAAIVACMSRLLIPQQRNGTGLKGWKVERQIHECAGEIGKE